MSQQKSQRRLLIIPTVVLVALAAVFIGFYQAVKTRRISINEWSLGPSSVRGVDISEYQANVDMSKLKEQGIQFAYIKATEGSTHVDARFSANWQNAKEAELPAGAYHFFNFESSGASQADNFINTVGESLDGRLIPAVDVEIYGDKEYVIPDKDSLKRELKEMLSRLEEQYHTKPIIYAQKDFYDSYLADFSDYPRWIRDVYMPAKWKNGDDWLIWQYNDRGRLDGYWGGEKYIDLDVINKNKTLEDLKIKQ